MLRQPSIFLRGSSRIPVSLHSSMCTSLTCSPFDGRCHPPSAAADSACFSLLGSLNENALCGINKYGDGTYSAEGIIALPRCCARAMSHAVHFPRGEFKTNRSLAAPGGRTRTVWLDAKKIRKDTLARRLVHRVRQFLEDMETDRDDAQYRLANA